MKEADSKPPAPAADQLMEKDSVVIRFAGDSGDGIQLTGERFTTTSAMMGEEVAEYN